jgi:hypothetical protein
VKYSLRYSQYIDALAHLMNTGVYIFMCMWTSVQKHLFRQ